MRPARPILLAASAILAAVLAGCGGNELQAEEPPSTLPTITIPQSEDAGPDAAGTSQDSGGGTTDEDAGDAGADATTGDATAGGTTSDSSSDGTATGTGGATTTDPGTTSGGTTSGGTTGGTADPEATDQGTQQQDSGATGGADADEGLDQFCADNPGAC